MLYFTLRNRFIEIYFKHIVYATGHVTRYVYFIASYQLSENTEIIYLPYVGTQKMQLYSTRESNLLPDIFKYDLEAGYSKWHQLRNSFNPSWQILGICKSINFASTVLHQTFCVNKVVLPVVVSVCLSVHRCYTYFATVPNSESVTHR